MRPRPMQALQLTLAILVVSFVAATNAGAQVLVVPERDLEFGLLTPGMQTVVDAADLVRSAQLTIEGRGTFQITLQLPASLTSPEGAQVPLQFGGGDGLLSIRHKATSFDPNSVLSFRLNPVDGEAQINLGGRALPAPGQAAGTYTATIVLMIVQTGT